MTETLPIGAQQLALAALLIGFNGALSVWLKLDLEKKLFIASLRTVVQLTIMGWLLLPIFELNSLPLVIALAAGMIVLSAWESARRVSRTYRGIYGTTFIAMLVARAPPRSLAQVLSFRPILGGLRSILSRSWA